MVACVKTWRSGRHKQNGHERKRHDNERGVATWRRRRRRQAARRRAPPHPSFAYTHTHTPHYPLPPRLIPTHPPPPLYLPLPACPHLSPTPYHTHYHHTCPHTSPPPFFPTFPPPPPCLHIGLVLVTVGIQPAFLLLFVLVHLVVVVWDYGWDLFGMLCVLLAGAGCVWFMGWLVKTGKTM